jgi:HK97 family phage prohead protease
MLLTFSGNIEAVDNGDRRTISGKIAPYGEVGATSAGRVVFAENSITVPEPSKVKLLMQHDNSKPVGRMQSVTSNKTGLYASFKVSASTRGSDAILLAQEQLMDGLSVGVEVDDSRQEKDYLLVTAATLKEVSLVESAAFPSAAVLKIAAKENAVDENKPTETKGETVDKTPEEVASEATFLPDGATVTLKSVSYEKDDAEGDTTPVEAARKIIKPSALTHKEYATILLLWALIHLVKYRQLLEMKNQNVFSLLQPMIFPALDWVLILRSTYNQSYLHRAILAAQLWSA